MTSPDQVDAKIQLTSRKADHVKLVVEQNVGIDNATNGYEYFEVIPKSVPNINFHDITLESKFLGRTFDAPILIAGMTGGYPEAEQINISLAKICNNLNIPFGVGSQRAMVVNPEMTPTFDVKREVPDVFLIGNLGLVQFSYDFDINHYQEAQEKIQADAMALHLNAFQELCQPEGDVNFSGAWENMEKICKESKVPVIGKEVGSGMGYEETVKMEKSGCSAVDIGGSGGTSWAKIELMRHKDELTPFDLDDPILNWGVPTAFATYEATAKSTVPIISTGGMYHGLMAVKALAMGATMVGIARPVLKNLLNHNESTAEKWLVKYIDTIKRAMFLMGAENISELRKMKSRLIPRLRARDWLSHRGFL